jgi:hypothetical protein
MMEITYQNKPGDTRASYEFIISKTAWGKKYSSNLLVNVQSTTIIYLLFFGIVVFGFTQSGKDPMGFSFFMIIFYELLILIISKFRPLKYYGMQGLIRSEKMMTPKDWKIYYQPKTVTIEKEWLKYSYPEAQHSWHWDIIDSVYSTPYFIFILIGNATLIIPNRDFATQQNFLEFSSTLDHYWKTENGISTKLEGEK